jgi:hypothetical protein
MSNVVQTAPKLVIFPRDQLQLAMILRIPEHARSQVNGGPGTILEYNKKTSEVTVLPF